MAPKKASRKAPTKKVPARKPASRKVASKKAAARKPAARKSAPKKPAAKTTAPKKAAAKAKPAFGRPGTAGKAEGDAPVQAYVASLRPEHREIVRKLDALIGETVPGVRRAMKWSMPMYGVEGKGWFAHVASFKEHVALGFFEGTSLQPQPPFGGSEKMRRVNLRDMGDYDEKRFRSWIEQAAALPGWGKVK